MQRNDLTPFHGVQPQLVGGARKFPTEVLIGLNRDNLKLHDVYGLDLVTRDLTKEVDEPRLRRLADRLPAGRPGPFDRSRTAEPVLVRDSADDDWRGLLTVRPTMR